MSPSGNSAANPMNVTVNHGDSANFTCSTEGGPNNVVQWFYNGTERLCSANCSADNSTIDIDGEDYNIVHCSYVESFSCLVL